MPQFVGKRQLGNLSFVAERRTETAAAESSDKTAVFWIVIPLTLNGNEEDKLHLNLQASGDISDV